MTDAPVLTKPKIRRRLRKIDAAMRHRIEEAIERMIETLDALDAPSEDLEPDEEGDGDVDDEYSLGSTEAFSHVASWRVSDLQLLTPDGEISLGSPGVTTPNNQVFSMDGFGSYDDREMHEDDEPSLGAPEPIEPKRGAQYMWFGEVYRVKAEDIAAVYSQTNWFRGGDRDLEYDDSEDGCE
jgi:hypothetical protein